MAMREGKIKTHLISELSLLDQQNMCFFSKIAEECIKLLGNGG
jgi:hypothetical protein